jgi:hypothetical protein
MYAISSFPISLSHWVVYWQEPKCQGEGAWITGTCRNLGCFRLANTYRFICFSVLITSLSEQEHLCSRKMRSTAKKSLWMLSKDVWPYRWKRGINSLSNAKRGEQVVQGPPAIVGSCWFDTVQIVIHVCMNRFQELDYMSTNWLRSFSKGFQRFWRPTLLRMLLKFKPSISIPFYCWT